MHSLLMFFSAMGILLLVASAALRKYSVVIFSIIVNLAVVGYVWVAPDIFTEVIGVSTGNMQLTTDYNISTYHRFYGTVYTVDLGTATIVKEFMYYDFTTKLLVTTIHLAAVIILIILAFEIPMAGHERGTDRLGWSMRGDEL